jgi:hypothetical protein
MKHLYFLFVIVLAGSIVTNAQVAPVKGTGSKYSFSNKNLYFEIDTADGARISSFKLNNKEILYLKSTADMNGSTFWPSPQYPSPPNFGWPPIAEIDNKAYSVVNKDNKLIVKSSLSTKYKLKVYKEFSANEADTSISIVYYLKNENTTAVSYAPWEVTRVTAAGITLFAKGDTVVTGDMSKSAIDSFGCYWYNQNKKQASGNKFFCDGMGWLAHVNTNNQVFIKKFEDISLTSSAKGEAEIEVYTTSDHAYTELEDQGAYVSIAAGDSIAWKVKWYAREIPAGITVGIGQKALRDFIIKTADLPVITDPVDTTHSSIIMDNVKKLAVFPNPANNVIQITGLQADESQLATIYNLQGAVVLKSIVSANNAQLDVSSIKSGSYLYEIKTNKGQLNRGVLVFVR